MPPYLRRRFRGWDWFTPRETRHLPWREQERLSQEAWEAVRHHPRCWLVTRFLPLLASLGMGLSALGLFLKTSPLSPLIFLPINLTYMVTIATALLWQRRHFRKALRQKLLDAGIRPAICFECGYNVEGYEGNECPACDAALLRQADSPSERS